MKSKSNITPIVVLSAMVVVLACLCIGLFLTRNTGNSSQGNKNVGVYNLKETDTKLPTFEMRVNGDYSGLINDQFVKEDKIKVYEFDATIDNGWDKVTNTYIGIRLNDLLDFYQLSNFTSVDFVSLNQITIKYISTEIKDDTFIVFYKDGKLITDTGRPMLLAVDYNYRYSLEDVIDMNFVVSDSDRVGNDENNDN